MSTPERERPDDDDLDRRFADLVSGWDLPAPERDLPERDLPERDPSPRWPETDAGEFMPAGESDTWRSWSPASPDPDEEWEAEGGFTPPPPQPLPGRDDAGFWAALIGLILGPALLLWNGLIRTSAPAWMWWLGLALTVGGFAILIARRPMRREHDPDQGAQV